MFSARRASVLFEPRSPLTAAKSQRKQERPEPLGVGTDILFLRRSPPPSLNSPSLYLFLSFPPQAHFAFGVALTVWLSSGAN